MIGQLDLGSALFILWAGTTVALGLGTFVAGLRFIQRHSRPYHEFMSDTERLDLFFREPTRYLAKAIPDGQLRSARLFTAADDTDVEIARHRTLRLAAATVGSAILGPPALWLAAGLVGRIGAELLDWVIVAFWLALLALAVKRHARPVALNSP